MDFGALQNVWYPRLYTLCHSVFKCFGTLQNVWYLRPPNTLAPLRSVSEPYKMSGIPDSIAALKTDGTVLESYEMSGNPDVTPLIFGVFAVSEPYKMSGIPDAGLPSVG